MRRTIFALSSVILLFFALIGITITSVHGSVPPVVHVSSIEELQDMIDRSPAVVATHGWMTIYLDKGRYEETVEDIGFKHRKVIELADKRNISIIGRTKDVAITIKESDEAFAHSKGVDVISITNSSNLELRGFTVEAKEYERIRIQNTRNIAIDDSHNITIKNLALNHQGYPGDARNIHIKMANSRDCVVSDSVISHGAVGIALLNADNNVIYNNTIYFGAITEETWSMYLNGYNNTITFNNLFGPAKDDGKGNRWNATTLCNYTHNGTTFTNYTGNYWNNYDGADRNNDRIGDVPYMVEGSAGAFDYYPLMEPQGLCFDVIVNAIARPSLIYANRTNVILASVECTGTYPLPLLLRANLTVNGGETYAERITMKSGEHKAVRFGWIPNNTGTYHLEIRVDGENKIEAVEEKNSANNNLTRDVAVSSAPYACTANITSALDFLNESQYSTGSISGFSTSEHAALAVTAAGEDPTRWKPYTYSLIDYLRNKPKDSVALMPPGANPYMLTSIEDIARMVLVISAVGEDPTDFGGVNYLVMLTSYYDGEQFGEADSVEDDALAVLALVSCGEKSQRTTGMIKNAANYIESTQNETDGGWGDVRTTALAIQARIAAESPVDLTGALNYLKNTQEEDGGFSDVETTAYSIQAIVAAGENPVQYTRSSMSPLDYLLRAQQKDGSFNRTPEMAFYPPRQTAFAIPALCARPYPVMIKELREDYDLPDISVDRIVLEESEVCVNTSYTVAADVRSNGGIFYVNLSSDEEFIQRKAVYSVWHDSLSRIEFSWLPNRTGSYNLTAFADSHDGIAELYEKNNNETITAGVALPDVYPTAIITHAAVYVNATNVITCTIKGTTDESFNVTLDVDGERVGKTRIERLRREITIPFEWRPAENGSHILSVTADAGGEVRERNERNNTLPESVDVVLPDLTARIPDEHGDLFVNATNEITVTVEGTAERFNISLIENGTVVGRTTNVTCYGKKNVSVIWKPRRIGNHTVTAFVDADNDREETEEGNNNCTATFVVLLPDIVPEEMTPGMVYKDEVNTISVVVNGTAEGFNATLEINKTGTDRSGPLYYVITPVFNGSEGAGETFSGNTTDYNLTYNITAQRANWSWEELNTLDVRITASTSSGVVDNGDTWCVDYVAVVLNYTTHNATIQTLELNARGVISPGNWSNGSSTYSSDNDYATVAVANETTTMWLCIADTDAVLGNVTSVVIKVEQHVVNAITPPSEGSFILKKTNSNTYNGSIAFEWLAAELGVYNLTVRLDSDEAVVETNETNNNMTGRVIVATRIDLELTSPLGGEVWDGIRNITWDAAYKDQLLIYLYYSPDKGYRWINIRTNETNSGSYAWNTEEVLDGAYMIKIIARSGMVTAEDQSYTFSVRNKNAGGERGDFHQNAGYAPCDGPDTNETAWVSEDIGAEGSSSLIVAKGKIFVYCAGWQQMYADYTYLVALDESSGEQLWGAKIAPREDWSWATPAYKDGSVFVSSGDGVYRIDADTGKIEWTFRFPTGTGSVNGGPAVTSRAVYVGDWDGRRYYCIDKDNATELWTFTVSGYSQSVPAIAYGNAYIGCAYDRNRVYCVDAWSAQELWNTSVSVNKHVCGSVTIADTIAYLTTFDFNGPGIFYALDAYNGTEIWSATIEQTDSTPAYYPSPCKSVRGYIYVAGGDATKEVCCLDAKTGNLVWRVPGLGSWTNSPMVTKDGKVFVGKECDDGGGMAPGYCGLYCLDALTGKELWHSEAGGSSPVVVNGFVYTIGAGRVFKFGNGTMPDLTVEAEADKDRYVVGEDSTINATIRNVGKSNVTKRFEVELKCKYEGTVTVIDRKTVHPPLNISSPRTIEFLWTPGASGEQYLAIEVDPFPGNVTESNTLNNTAYINVSVGEPDLTASILTVSPERIYVGDTVTVEATITNVGYETTKPFYVRFSVDEAERERKYTSLENDSLTSQFTWNALMGTHTLTVEANPWNNPEAWVSSIKESNYNNNTDSRNVTVEVMPTPTPTPKPKEHGFGPGSGGGIGEGSADGIGAERGTGEAGSGDAGGMQVPVNASSSGGDTSKEVLGYPFGDTFSGGSGGGGTLPVLLVLMAILLIALFYFGYHREKRAHAKHIHPKTYRRKSAKK
jgi:parallel beta-helix repeat protein